MAGRGRRPPAAGGRCERQPRDAATGGASWAAWLRVAGHGQRRAVGAVGRPAERCLDSEIPTLDS